MYEGTACGSLLEANTAHKRIIVCDVCSTENEDTSSKVVVTSSKPSAFPSTLRTKLTSDVQEISESDVQTDAVIRETCEKCGHDEVRFYTQQLRSADEGSTVRIYQGYLKIAVSWLTTLTGLLHVPELRAQMEHEQLKHQD